MLPIKTLVKRARATLHDSSGVTYDDDEIIDVLNNGIRFIRRTIAEIQPELLIESETGLLQPGESSVVMGKRPLRLVRVRAGDEVLSSVTEKHSELIHKNTGLIFNNQSMIYNQTTTTKYKERTLGATNLRHLPDEDGTGAPRCFYRTGIKTIHFWPVPQKVTAYTIDAIYDIDEVSIEDNSPLITDFDDFLMEYMALRLAIGNEYEESQETQIMMNIYNQIRDLLAPPPVGVVAKGYWQGGGRRKGGGY